MYKAYSVDFATARCSGTIKIIEKEENINSRMMEYGNLPLAVPLTGHEFRNPNKQGDRFKIIFYNVMEVSLDKIKISDLSALDFLNLLKITNR